MKPGLRSLEFSCSKKSDEGGAVLFKISAYFPAAAVKSGVALRKDSSSRNPGSASQQGRDREIV